MALGNTDPLEHLSDSQIVQRCSDPNRQIIGNFENIVQLSQEVVGKFGWGVTAEEAHNQRRAFELLDCDIVRVPKLYRFFTRSYKGGHLVTGYIVMEYIHGHISQSPNRDQIDKIVQILSYFSNIQSQDPGPLQRGVSRGLLQNMCGNYIQLGDIRSEGYA